MIFGRYVSSPAPAPATFGTLLQPWQKYDCDTLDKIIDKNLGIMWKTSIFDPWRAQVETEVNEMKAWRKKKKCKKFRLV